MIYRSLQIFIGQLDKLLNHLHILEGLDSVSDEILASNLVDDIKNHAVSILRKDTDEKIFDYNANIISLYGYWEQYIEAVIKEYLAELKRLNSGNDAKNETIRFRYRNSIIDLFHKITGNSPKFRHLTNETLVNAMYVGFSQKQNNYIPEAFFQSGGNYNYAETSDCLRRLGFSSIDNELKFYPDLKRYFTSQGFTEDTLKNASADTLYSKLNNLVIYRNEIAHGGSDGSNLLSLEVIMDYIAFMKSFASSITECFNDDILAEKWTLKKCNPIKVSRFYDNLHVAELGKGTFFLDMNNEVICYKGPKRIPHYMFVKIKEMKINGIDADSPYYLSLDYGDTVTVKFDKDVKSGFKLKFEE